MRNLPASSVTHPPLLPGKKQREKLAGIWSKVPAPSCRDGLILLLWTFSKNKRPLRAFMKPLLQAR
jgi:hypothetical protein